MSPKSGRSKPALDYEVCPLSPTRERVRVREIESDAHKALKAHVENHPDLVGLDSSATSEQEYYFRTPLGERRERVSDAPLPAGEDSGEGEVL